MPQPRRHDPHPWQDEIVAHLRAIRPRLTWAHVAPVFRRHALAASDGLVRGILAGSTGATGAELLCIMEAYGLEAAAEALARMAGRTLAPMVEREGDTLRGLAAQTVATMGALLTALEDAEADGEVDEDERAGLLRLAEAAEALTARLRTRAGRAA